MREFQLFIVLAVATGACVPASNPCDPASPLDVQREGTGLSGRVLDQDGVGVSGVVMSVVGGAETAVSGVDGAFAIVGLVPASAYGLRAEPIAPLAGGTTQVGGLACREVKEGLEVRVVRPLEPPEVEVVKAVSPTSLMVAFGAPVSADEALPDVTEGFYADGDAYREAGAVADDCRARAAVAARSFRVQVRAPFDVWQDAVLSTFPWIDGDAAVNDASDGAAVLSERIDDVCAASLCAQFRYLEPALDDQRARCATVVGVIEDGVAVPLAAYGSYEVRVLADVHVDPALRDVYGLPTLVASAASARPRQMSLVPGALLPVVDGDGNPVAGRDQDVVEVVPVAGGRFALVEGDGVQVIGGGADVFGNASDAGVVDAPHDALATDGATEANIADDFNDDGALTAARAITALPAGDWLRVIKEDDSIAMMEKLYLGESSTSGTTGPAQEELERFAAAEARMPMRPSETPLGTLRAVSYLEPGAAALTAAGANPSDAYVLLYERGFVLIENAAPGSHALAHFVAADDGAGSFNTTWADPVDARLGTRGFGGRCAVMETLSGAAGRVFGNAAADADVNGNARTDLAVCFDLTAATGEALDLRAIEPFAGGTLHIVADARNDRLLVAPHESILGTNARPLLADVVVVPVGREPVAMTRSRVLDCGAGSGNQEVLLVANAGSADVSVVALVDGALSEVAVLELPTVPSGFVSDPDGPTCSDPFAWVLGADGRVLPIDLRGAPSLPVCDGAACAIGSRGRAKSGAIARGARGGRAVVGGASLVGELGFFRPAALRGAAFEQF